MPLESHVSRWSRLLLLGGACSWSLFVGAEVRAQAEVVPETWLLPAATPELVALSFDLDGSCRPARRTAMDGYRDLSPLHQRMLLSLLARPADSPVVHGCWIAPPSPAAAALFNAAIRGTQDFQPTNRWTSTATQPGGLGQGDPTTLTYSFVPDGTFIPNGVGEGAGNSSLFSTFNSVFPNQATWQNRIHAAFARWGELTGVTYVHEPNDDGASLFSNGGVLGVRGDVRIGAKFVDGSSNTLAYNMYPNGGDMVLDIGDVGNFSVAASNYRFLFNTVSHEHGHGLGIAHVCPLNDTKLMEPLLSTAFEGPQFDDILSAQRLYGDPREPNDTVGVATDLGTLLDGLTNVTNVSLDGPTDSDWFRFTLTTDAEVTIRAIPTGAPYLEGPQVGNCSTGSVLDPTALRNLQLYLYNSTGAQLLGFAISQPAGATETIANQPLAPGTYHARVFAPSFDAIQMYRLEVDVTGPQASATAVGASCGGLNWTNLNQALLGGNLVMVLQNIPNPTSTIGLVLLGYTGIPGGLDLGFLGAPSCFLHTDVADVRTLFPVTAISLPWFLPIPNNPTLAGAVLLTQGALLVPPGTNPLGLLTANAVQVTLGY